MLKKSAEAKARTSLEVKCKDCMHFQTGPKQYEALCKDLGVKPNASPCDAFFPDVIQIRDVQEGVLEKLKEVYDSLNPGQARIIAVFMARNEWFKKTGLRLTQEVYLTLGQDFLCNYVRGYVVGVTKDGNEVFLTSTLEKLNKGKNASLRLMRDSILTIEEFEKKRKELIKAGRVMEPPRTGIKRTTFQLLSMTKKEHAEYAKLLTVKPDDYSPPTLDSVPDSWRDGRSVNKVIDPMLLKKEKKKAKGSKETKSIKINRG